MLESLTAHTQISFDNNYRFEYRKKEYIEYFDMRFKFIFLIACLVLGNAAQSQDLNLSNEEISALKARAIEVPIDAVLTDFMPCMEYMAEALFYLNPQDILPLCWRVNANRAEIFAEQAEFFYNRVLTSKLVVRRFDIDADGDLDLIFVEDDRHTNAYWCYREGCGYQVILTDVNDDLPVEHFRHQTYRMRYTGGTGARVSTLDARFLWVLDDGMPTILVGDNNNEVINFVPEGGRPFPDE